jgi:hypothetical protein
MDMHFVSHALQFSRKRLDRRLDELHIRQAALSRL